MGRFDVKTVSPPFTGVEITDIYIMEDGTDFSHTMHLFREEAEELRDKLVKWLEEN